MESSVVHEPLITWAVTALLVVLALWAVWPPFRRWYARRRMERRIAASGVKQLRNVLLDNGMGGQAFYEWLLLTPQEIRVLVTNGRDGIIFAGERMDTWAQVMGKRTIRFANPLYSLEEAVSTLRYHLPKLNIEGHILFIGQCSFPKGRPGKVLTPEDLGSREPDDQKQAVQPVLEQAWEKLQELSRRIDPASEGYLLPVTESPAYGRWLLFGVLLGATAAWLYWRL